MNSNKMKSNFIRKFGGDIELVCKQVYLDFNYVNYKFLIAGNEVVLSLAEINTNTKVLSLAKYGLNIFEEDAEDVQAYIQEQFKNGDYETEVITNVIGNVEGKWRNPFDPDYKVICDDPGTAKYISAFKKNGDLEVWKEDVFAAFSDSPNCIFYIASAVASVTLQHLGVPPFIVDINAQTSTGKTTLAEVAISAFGTKDLLTPWNATEYGIEQLAIAANNFFISLDDTQKANKSKVKDIIYNFTNGQGKLKGQGKVNKTQKIRFWNNILLSSGEHSILEFTGEAGGASARCISLENDWKRLNKEDFLKVTEGYKNNYGVLGAAFLEKWIEATEENPKFKKDRYFEISKELTNNVTNNVLDRLADSFAAVVLTAELLNEWFNMEIEIEKLFEVFSKMCESNQKVDMPKAILIDILTEIDAKRDYLGKYNGNYYVRNKELCFTVNFLKKRIGLQSKVVRAQWLKNGLVNEQLHKNEIVDYKRGYAKVEDQVVHPSVVTINLSTVEELGFSL